MLQIGPYGILYHEKKRTTLFSLTHTHSISLTHTRTLSLSHTHALYLSLTHTHSISLTHTHTHTNRERVFLTCKIFTWWKLFSLANILILFLLLRYATYLLDILYIEKNFERPLGVIKTNPTTPVQALPETPIEENFPFEIIPVNFSSL